MLPALLLTLTALGAAVLRLLAYRNQLADMACVLEETPAESNLRLTVQMNSGPVRRLCRAVNARLESGRQLRLDILKREQEVKYTMAAISHDIRTPLAGAMGYLQLLVGEPARQEEYLDIIKKRLEELEELLDSLFLYTRLQSDSLTLECGHTAVLLPLWDALAEFYPQLEAAGIQPELRFDREDMQAWANPNALGRVYRNLIANALRHGGGGLTITVRDGEICLSNPLGPGSEPDSAYLFDRFYQGNPARGKGGAGLGLSIVRELMEHMGGHVSAQTVENKLHIRLYFPTESENKKEIISDEGDKGT